MSDNTLEIETQRLISAIELCLQNRLDPPGLILTYTTIDIMAWLDRDESHEDVQRSDFIRWVETYLLPDSGLPCTAIDLYAARCSLIHSYSAESKLSREGKASQIMYAWGSAQEQELQKLIDWEGSRNAKAVHVEKLFRALTAGIGRFFSTTDKAELIRERSTKLFSDMPPITVKP